MSVNAAPTIALLLSILFLGGSVRIADAQHASFTTIEQNADGLVVDITIDWRLPLNMIVDSTGLDSFSPAAAHALVLGVPYVSEIYELPSSGAPSVSVRASDFDEIKLPAGEGDLSAYSGQPVEMTDVGYSRTKPVANLIVNLLAYNPSGGMVRRYRNLRVSIRYARPQSADDVGFLRKSSGDDNPHLEVERSVLAGGIIYKIPITQEGIYRIDREFLSNLPGLERSPDTIDPDNVKVYGNGGVPLPALNSAPRPADLLENPVSRSGGGDGRFDSGDAILFYGKGPSGWTLHATSGVWEHYVHPFSSENFYFIKIDEEDGGATVGEGQYPNFADADVVTSVEGRFFRDFEEFMWSKENGTGHTWVSRTIRPGTTRPLLENERLPGLAAGSVQYEARLAIRSNPIARVYLESGSIRLAEQRATRTVTQDATSPAAVASVSMFSQDVAAGAPINLSMRLDPQASNVPEAAADWIRVFYSQNLQASGDSLRFSSPRGQTGRLEFVLGGFSSQPHVWDVTDHAEIRRLGVRSDGGTYRVQVEVDNVSQPRELLAFAPATARPLAASTAQRVAAQNMHGITTYPDFVIVTPEDFRQAAEELAEYRVQDGLQVEIADIQKIYNEFSGGLQDMRAMRDFFKFLYDRAPDDARRLRYVLFFGDGHFNYRNLGDEALRPVLQNWLPPYETEVSFDPVESYTSDDYFGLLDDNEGIWSWPGLDAVGNEIVDIGIGRFPVQSQEEAAAMVEKVKRYENPETYGAWRSRYLFVADDAFNGVRATEERWPDLHTQNADVVAELIDEEYPRIDIEKVYAISYTRDFQNGWRIPGAESDVLSAINEGVLVMNYAGHGGEHGLAQEEIFTTEDAANLQNRNKLPVFVTATCSFGWWDLVMEQSGAEILLLNPNGGAIALMTTVRLVYTSSDIHSLNVGLNRSLSSEMFKRDEDNRPRRLGDIMQSTKMSVPGREGNNRKFNLLGDPTVRLGTPPGEAVIETVNGQAVAERPNLRALDLVTLAGSVRTMDDQVDGSFDGQMNVTVYDAERRVQLPVRRVMPRDYYTVREDLIWRGVVPVTGGHFEATFVVPKDISYSDASGRISVYASNTSRHAGGFTENVVVGGTSANPPEDDMGPEISLFLNDTTFVSGGMTPPTPRLIVKLRDDSGINAVGAGVGHEMLLVVDGEEQNAIDISGRFESDPNSYRSGSVAFSFEEYAATLDDGPHTLSVRAWDVLNNSSEARLEFFVSSLEDLVLRNVFNYPNPTSGRTRFIFEHNQPTGTTADVQVRIYTLAGRPVRTLDSDEALPTGILTAGPVQVLWDGRDEDLNLVASGIYLYKVRVAVDGTDGERHVSERIEKVAVIR